MSQLSPLDSEYYERYDPPTAEENAFAERPDKKDWDYYCLGLSQIKRGDYEGQWKYCYARAGSGTGHLGQGRCKHHGGKAPHIERRYQDINNPTISEKIAKHMQDTNMLDLRPELAASRAIFEDFIERYDEFITALLAWHASFEASRRGLHDKPLYHVDVVRHAHLKLTAQGVKTPSKLQWHDALESSVDEVRDIWIRDVPEGEVRRADLAVERPRQVLDISHATKILALVGKLTGQIIKHEQEAYLSAFAVEEILTRYGQGVGQELQKLSRRLKALEEEGGDALNVEVEIQKLQNSIARTWQKLPAITSSHPRADAEARERERFLEGG